MNIVPIVFAFDKNLVFPASVSIFSLLTHAKESTFYDIYILYPASDAFDRTPLENVVSKFPNCKIHYRAVGNCFDSAFEIRGITTPAYYRLLIPELIPNYDVILYSDVDVIFRKDLYDIYASVNFEDCDIAGVNSLSFLNEDYNEYFRKKLHLDSHKIIYSGNLIFNSKKIREDDLVTKFKERAKNDYMFQDMDVLNIVCENKIKYLPPEFCMSTFISEAAIYNKSSLLKIWNEQEITEALKYGIVHYNGVKPWKSYCINFDIWWEYYRMSPVFDEKFYFDFFYQKLNELDSLSLWKRVKILIRYFVYGRK